MTPTAQTAALAKHLGLDRQYVLMKRGHYYRPNAMGYTDQLSEAWKVSEAVAKEHVNPHDTPVTMHQLPWPDWAGDLNAMHEVEKTLDGGQFRAYTRALMEVVSPGYYPVIATAAQRLEAMVRALNLWDDSL